MINPQTHKKHEKEIFLSFHFVCFVIKKNPV